MPGRNNLETVSVSWALWLDIGDWCVTQNTKCETKWHIVGGVDPEEGAVASGSSLSQFFSWKRKQVCVAGCSFEPELMWG